jgi:hypothetical protein
MDPATTAALAAGTAATGGFGLLAAAAIPAVAGIVSSYMQAGNNADAQKAIEEAVAKYGPEARALIEQELGGPSAMAEVYGERLAPEAAAAQRRALQQLQQVSEKGYTPEEEAALRQIQAETAATAASNRAATQEAFARRGITGGGAERVAAFQGAQAASNRAAQQGLDVAANAQRRAFQAMQQTGSLGGSMRQQAYGEAKDRALAEEQRRINRANMGMDVMNRSTDMYANAKRQGATVANQPLQATSEAFGRTGQAVAGYLGAPSATTGSTSQGLTEEEKRRRGIA